LEDITPFKLPSGEIVYVETESARTGESRAARIQTLFGPSSQTPEQSPPDLEKRIGPVVEALHTMRAAITSMEPDEVVLEASIKFVGSAGVILAKYGAEASVSVKLKWTKTKKAEADKEDV
jgi:hypothetical protein